MSGPYLPPAKRVKQESLEKGSEDHQKFEWGENKRKITGLINRANTSNITVIVKELFKCNLIRYRGLFASALLRAQELSPSYTEVYAALLAIINSRFPKIGILVIHRLILNYRLAFKTDNKRKMLAVVNFLAHLTNQEVIHEMLAFSIIEHLINRPTPSSVEIVVAFIKEVGAKLEELNPAYLFKHFKSLRDLSLEGELETRVHEMIDMIHIIKKEKFKDHPPVKPSLDLVDKPHTHEIKLDEPTKEDFQLNLNYFKFDRDWNEKEAKYEEIKQSLLDSGSESESESEDDSDSEYKTDDNKLDVKPTIIDETSTDLTAFRRTIYLIIRSSVRHDEVVHKILKAKIKPELNEELCKIIVDCCGQERTYEPIYGLVAAKICQIKRREFSGILENMLQLFYENVHKFEGNKVTNIAKFYANLLITESIDWACLNCLRLREGATTSVGRCFIKFLFLELVSKLSLPVLIKYIRDPDKEAAFNELFPKDKEEDIRFAINFFTCSNLGQLTEDLRQELVVRQELADKQG